MDTHATRLRRVRLLGRSSNSSADKSSGIWPTLGDIVTLFFDIAVAYIDDMIQQSHITAVNSYQLQAMSDKKREEGATGAGNIFIAPELALGSPHRTPAIMARFNTARNRASQTISPVVSVLYRTAPKNICKIACGSATFRDSDNCHRWHIRLLRSPRLYLREH